MKTFLSIIGGLVFFGGLFYAAKYYIRSRNSSGPKGTPGGGGSGSQPK